MQKILEQVDDDNAIYPFNKYEYLICSLIEKKGLTYQDYLEIRQEYISANPNLWIFEISALRGFGKQFETYVKAKSDKLKYPTKELDKDYQGEYDLWLEGIRIEVKASRAVDADSEEPLYIKALSKNTEKRFLMNFQQLKPQCCDVFIWLAVFRDEIVIWVMNADEVATHELFSQGQHRGNHGNEGQLHIKNDNIHLFNQYKLQDNNIEKAIKDAFERK